MLAPGEIDASGALQSSSSSSDVGTFVRGIRSNRRKRGIRYQQGPSIGDMYADACASRKKSLLRLVRRYPWTSLLTNTTTKLKTRRVSLTLPAVLI